MTSEVRSKVWWLLGSLFLERPNQAFVDELRRVFPVDREDVNDDERTLIEGLHAEDASLAERLSQEYTRLFRGISAGLGPPPPYESLYRGDRLMGQFAEAVRRHYSAAGFGDLVPPTTLPDHLGTELQFLAMLSLREAEAEAEAERPRARRRPWPSGRSSFSMSTCWSGCPATRSVSIERLGSPSTRRRPGWRCGLPWTYGASWRALRGSAMPRNPTWRARRRGAYPTGTDTGQGG
jgi:TorA maturation chaperone TorD